MAYQFPLNGGRINATISGNTAGAGSLVSTGTLTLAGGNNITLSQAGNAITISGGAGGGGGAAISAAGASASNGTVVFSNSNGVGFGMNGSTITASHNGLTSQTVQTQNMVSVQGSTGDVSFANGGGVTFGGNNSTMTAAVATTYAGSNHSHGNPTLALTNLSGTTASASNGLTLSLSAAAPGGGGGGIALSGGGTSYSNGTVHLSNHGGALTISGSTNSVLSISVPQTSSLSATGAVSISTNGSTIFIGAGGASPQMSYYQNLAPQNSLQPYTTLGIPFRTMLIQPLSPMEGLGLPGDITVSTMMLQMSGSQTATSATSAWSSSFSSSVSVGMYQLVNSSQLTLINSASTSWSAPANTQNSTIWAGPRFLTFHSSQWSSSPVLSYGERYWYGVINNSSNFTSMGPSWLGQYIGASTQRSGTIGISQVTNTSQGMVPFLGIYATSLTSMPGSIANSQINKVNVSAGFMPAIVLNATFGDF